MPNKEMILPKDIMIVSETDQEGKIIFANTDFCKISGYSMNELIGKPHNIVRSPDMPKAAFKELWQTIQSGGIWKGIVKNKTKKGDFYWVNATAFPSKNVDGTLRFISIRVKPTIAEIENAQKLYRDLK